MHVLKHFIHNETTDRSGSEGEHIEEQKGQTLCCENTHQLQHSQKRQHKGFKVVNIQLQRRDVKHLRGSVMTAAVASRESGSTGRSQQTLRA